MEISLVLVFFTTLLLSYYEEQLSKRTALILYVAVGVALVLLAGLREVGSTPDTEAYEDMFTGKYEAITEAITEPSFLIISDILNNMSLGINSLFFTYAIISISIHLSAFRKFSKLPFMTLAIYISFYYMMHDLVQIRAGVASGLFIWAMYFLYEGRRKLSVLFVIIGIFFHYSAAVGFAIFLFKNRMHTWEKNIMYAIIPFGLVAYFINLDISCLIPDGLGGAKLEYYRELKEYGVDEDQAGYPLKYHVVIWLNIFMYFLSLYYHDYLTTKVKYATIALKTQALAFACLFFLNGVSSVLATRLNNYFSVASIFLWSSFVYLFTPLYVGKIINACLSAFRFVVSALFFALSWYFK